MFRSFPIHQYAGKSADKCSVTRDESLTGAPSVNTSFDSNFNLDVRLHGRSLRHVARSAELLLHLRRRRRRQRLLLRLWL